MILHNHPTGDAVNLPTCLREAYRRSRPQVLTWNNLTAIPGAKLGRTPVAKQSRRRDAGQRQSSFPVTFVTSFPPMSVMSATGWSAFSIGTTLTAR
jgi:hypothetical protein